MSAEKMLHNTDTKSNQNSRIKSTEYSAESSLNQTPSIINTNSTDKRKNKVHTGQYLKTDNSNSLKRQKSVCCNQIAQCIWGTLLVMMAISGFIYTPLDFLLWEKLHMRPGFPPYEWWSKPPDAVKLLASVFNVTNHDRFIQGLDQKLNVEDIGPIVYLEKLEHYNSTFNENGTLTYTEKRTAIYLPEENTIDLNSTIIVPNMALLGLASYLHNAPFFVPPAFEALATTLGSQFFHKKTIYDFLWDYREPLLSTSSYLAPGLVPVKNMGMLSRVYADFTDTVTVKVGTKFGHKQFFHIDKFRGEPQLPGYDPDVCSDRINGSTEGVMYSQRLNKQDVLLYWRKTVCKLMPLYFDDELIVDNVPVYRYNLTENVFSRVTNGTDCYDTVPTLPVGLSDASKCYFDFPIVVSYPHFYTGDPPKDTYVTGLNPDRGKHNSYAVIEPITGTPFRSVARMLSNLRIHDLHGFSSKYHTFSNLVIPLLWLEYNQGGLPDDIRLTIYFLVVILPPLSAVILTIMLMSGFYLIFGKFLLQRFKNDSLYSLLNLRKQNVNKFAKNKILLYETENFDMQHK